MVCINIAVDSRQVAGWEQVSAGKTDKEPHELKEAETFLTFSTKNTSDLNVLIQIYHQMMITKLQKQRETLIKQHKYKYFTYGFFIFFPSLMSRSYLGINKLLTKHFIGKNA